MAEDMGDKTEAPTPRRRQEAREEGNVARSADLSAAVLLIGTIMLLNWYGPGLVKALRTLMAEMFGSHSLSQLDTTFIGVPLLRSLFATASSVAPVFLGLVVLALVVNVAQVGLMLNGKKLQPDLARLNPMKGLGRIFGGGQGFVHFAMTLLKVTLVALVAYSAIHNRLAQIVTVQQLSFMQIFGLATEIVYSIAMRIGVLLLVLAVIDYVWQRFRVERELRMTKQEVKEEMRRMEGDPHIKQRRRQIANQIALQRLKKSVPTADVVVTNPTEFAVALKYDAATMRAPRVVAKGQGHIAARIRALAIENGVPILERKPLARALFRLVEVGQEIPEQFYSAVAEILAYVYELSGKLRQKQAV